MSQVDKVIKELQEVIDYFKGLMRSPIVEIRNTAYNYAVSIQLGIQMIQSYQLSTKLGIEENNELRTKIKALESHELEPILKEKRNNFIDYIISELEDLKI